MAEPAKPLPSAHDAFLKRSAAFAESLGAPPGTYAVVIRSSGSPIPIIGSVNGPRGRLDAAKDQRLLRAREALDALQRRQFRKW